MIRLMMVAAASLLAVVLTGCGESDNKPAEPSATVTTTTTPPADVSKPTNANEEQPAEQH